MALYKKKALDQVPFSTNGDEDDFESAANSPARDFREKVTHASPRGRVLYQQQGRRKKRNVKRSAALFVEIGNNVAFLDVVLGASLSAPKIDARPIPNRIPDVAEAQRARRHGAA